MNASDIAKIFRKEGLTLGSAESFTGGLFASDIISIAGASHFFKGSFVTYATEEKVRLLGLTYSDIDKYGVVSQETAGAMAGHAQKLLNVDYCVSFTGNAGPDVMENKDPGTAYIGVASKAMIRVFSFNFKGSREEIRKAAVETAYNLLDQIIKIENN